VSLVPTSSPPALVSTDVERQVKVWSTSGELWSHFSMSGVDPGSTFLWPPPHVIAAQHALMTIAKGLCKKLGLRTSGVSQDKLSASSKAMPRRNKPKQKAGKENGNSSASEKKPKEQEKKKQEKRVIVVGDENEADEVRRQRLAGKGKEVSSESEDVPPQFMTEPAISPSAPSASAAADSESAKKPASPPRPGPSVAKAKEADAEADAEAGKTAASKEVSDENFFDDGDVIETGGVGDGGAGDDEREEDGAPKARSRAFSREQMTKMVRNRGFSSGFQSYNGFMMKSSSQGALDLSRRSGESLSQLESQRSSFFGREASDFGVSFITKREENHWDRSIRGMGARSSSEGALLKYALTGVQEATKSVYEELGVDVSRTDMNLLKRPSFLARLDRRPEVEQAFLRDPSSSTAQAVAKMYGVDPSKNKARLSIKKSSALSSSGKSVVKK
jgi:hypothetical protein